MAPHLEGRGRATGHSTDRRGAAALAFRILALCILLPSLALADITGRASVIDGDTIDIYGTRIRLHGIDAPEAGQTCRNHGRLEYRCGQSAAVALAGRIGSATVRCEERDKDQYGRTVAVCYQGNDDINAWMVSSGWAVAYQAYSSDYVEQEATARSARAGIWIGKFVMPADWRRGQRSGVAATPSAAAPGACQIKGNVSGKGERIYHVPGQRDYDATKINEGKGERWFCTEAEARTAGWRRSIR